MPGSPDIIVSETFVVVAVEPSALKNDHMNDERLAEDSRVELDADLAFVGEDADYLGPV